jgi:hypothetical protein
VTAKTIYKHIKKSPPVGRKGWHDSCCRGEKSDYEKSRPVAICRDLL